MRNNYIRFFISAAVAAGVFYFLWKVVLREDLSLLSFNFAVRWGMAALVLNFVPLLVKSIRFHYFLRGQVPKGTILGTAAIHSFWNYLLPFRVGELSYVYLIKKTGRVSTAETITSLVAGRIFDVFVVMLLLSIASFLLFTPNVVGSLAIQFLWGGVLVGLVGALILGKQADKLTAFLGRRSLRFQEKGLKVFAKIFTNFRGIVTALGRLNTTSSLAVFFILSIFVWVSDFIFVWTALRAAGLVLSPASAIFIAAFPVIAGLLPLQTPVGIGTFEGTMLAGFALLGITGPQAVSASIILHAELVFFSFIYALLGYWFYVRPILAKKISDSPESHTEFYQALQSPAGDFRNRNLAELLVSYAKGSSLLDVGCGYGLLLLLAKQRGYQAVGIEPDPKIRLVGEEAFGRLEIYPSAIRDFNPPKLFDTVTMIDVLECLEQDKEALARVVSWVSPGGRLVLAVPAHPLLFGTRDKMLKYFRRYSKKDLVPVLQNLGFNKIYTRHWNVLGVLPYAVLYKLLSFRSHFEGWRGGGANGVVRTRLSSLLNFWFRHVENRLNAGLGLTLIVVAEKE
ncbi:MAG: flippase-like domain-containing protein [Candidatus Sungiibacteriota bacterium]|uniref:Flippase-like domain-containing protein n=1 Tax=Candidatus Sungiibacteriota bacterium TaxID=2750080 RepID=A0A7T5RJC8_9BACT|nr:MAG: flippase-like domain-containing protein [Candidatus Sungbacteria bacterium]